MTIYIPVELKDEKSCEGCPLLLFWYNYGKRRYYCKIKYGRLRGRTGKDSKVKRPKRCIEELGK